MCEHREAEKQLRISAAITNRRLGLALAAIRGRASPAAMRGVRRCKYGENRQRTNRQTRSDCGSDPQPRCTNRGPLCARALSGARWGDESNYRPRWSARRGWADDGRAACECASSSARQEATRTAYGQFSEVRSGKTGPAPGTFELSKGMMK